MLFNLNVCSHAGYVFLKTEQLSSKTNLFLIKTPFSHIFQYIIRKMYGYKFTLIAII